MKIIFPLLGLCALIMSCDPNRVYENYEEIPNMLWNTYEPLTYEMEVPDSLKKYNVYLNFRHAHQYPYSNIWLVVKFTSPKGYSEEKRMQFTFAKDDGEWTGDCIGDICDNKQIIMKDARLEQGIYKFEVEQNMRQDPLIGVMEVALRLELSESI